MVFSTGSAEEMIANCDVLITRFSSTAFVGLALGKETHSDFDMDELRRLMPVQNNSAASQHRERLPPASRRGSREVMYSESSGGRWHECERSAR